MHAGNVSPHFKVFHVCSLSEVFVVHTSMELETYCNFARTYCTSTTTLQKFQYVK